MQKELKRVSDVVGFTAKSVDAESIIGFLDKDVIIKGFDTLPGKFGDYILIRVELDGEDRILRTSSDVVKRKLDLLKTRNEFPIIGKFIKVKRYFDVV